VLKEENKGNSSRALRPSGRVAIRCRPIEVRASSQTNGGQLFLKVAAVTAVISQVEPAARCFRQWIAKGRWIGFQHSECRPVTFVYRRIQAPSGMIGSRKSRRRPMPVRRRPVLHRCAQVFTTNHQERRLGHSIRAPVPSIGQTGAASSPSVCHPASNKATAGGP
jgi:hypothetical protein